MKVVSELCLLRTPLLNWDTSTEQNPQISIPEEAIFLASSELYEQMQKAKLQQPETLKSTQALTLTLEKYRRRMSYRCTPFGLFAGVSMARFGPSTQVNLVEQSSYRKHTRLSMDYVCGLAQAIIAIPDVLKGLRLWPNNTLYPIGKQLRYMEYVLQKDMRVHHLVHIDDSPYVQAVLAKAAGGAMFMDLISVLISEEIEEEDAAEFLHEMLGGQVLITELEPTVTGVEYWRKLVTKIDELATLNATSDLVDLLSNLRQIDKLLDLVNSTPIGDSIEYYNDITVLVKKLPAPFDLKHLFQVDMVKPTQQATISTLIPEEATKALHLLARLQPSAEEENLTKFKETFRERYDLQEVPLLEVLDFDLGIGYPVNQGAQADHSPLLDGFPHLGEAQIASYPQNPWQRYLLKRYLELIKAEGQELRLLEEQVAPFATFVPTLPASFSLGCTVLAGSAQEIDNGNFLLQLAGVSGPSAANVMGRFCHAEPALTTAVQNILKTEEAEQPDALFAEIAHLPQSRVGNISIRPVLRKYEIPIGLPSAVDEEHTIYLTDLLVSIQNNRVVLRSKRLQREIIPCLTTAHNYSLNPLPVYHFLCDLQGGSAKSLSSWHWGSLGGAPFLPRVTYGKTILARARWTVELAELDSPNLTTLVAHLQARNVPQRVVITEGDNIMPLDTGDESSTLILWQLLLKQKSLTLWEDLVSEQTMWVTGPEGKFACELIIPFEQSRQATPFVLPPLPSNTRNHTSAKRSFTPGSEWFYVKIYCSVQTADRVLVESILPMAQELVLLGSISKWFFIRYGDPHHHLRVRFQGDAGVLFTRLNECLRAFEANGLIHKVQIDTYERELERYGAHNIEDSESLFYFDSLTAVSIISILAGKEGKQFRWQIALKGVDTLLTDLGFSLAEKQNLLAHLSRGHVAKFADSMYQPKDFLRSKFRQHRRTIEEVLQGSHPHLEPALQYFSLRSQYAHGCVAAIINSGFDKYDLAGSYVHMFLNRFLRSKQPMQELVIYDLLHEYYKSCSARARKT